MSERDAFILAICAEPAEDTPRLAFADWCDENGEPERAEFIRLQILLHNTSFIRKGGAHCVWPEPWSGRILRVAELLKTNAQKWAGSVARLNPGWSFRLLPELWSRGFMERVTFPFGGFFANVREVFREHPVGVVRLDGRGPQQDFAEGPTRHRWLWTRALRETGLRAHDVPAVLFDQLNQPADGYKWADDAWSALSAVLVGYGRVEAGLTEPAEAA